MGMFIGSYAESTEGVLCEEIQQLQQEADKVLDKAMEDDYIFQNLTALQQWLSEFGLIALPLSPIEEAAWYREQTVQEVLSDIDFPVIFRAICESQSFCRLFVALFFYQYESDVIGHS